MHVLGDIPMLNCQVYQSKRLQPFDNLSEDIRLDLGRPPKHLSKNCVAPVMHIVQVDSLRPTKVQLVVERKYSYDFITLKSAQYFDSLWIEKIVESAD